MRRTILQDVANTLCHMLVGWRMGDDFDVLAALPDGTLFVDVLAGTAAHSAAGAVHLRIAGKLQAWFHHRLSVIQIPVQALSSAQVVAEIRTDRLATNRKRIVSFDVSVRSVISTDECRYTGKLHEVHRWHSRVPTTCGPGRMAPWPTVVCFRAASGQRERCETHQ